MKNIALFLLMVIAGGAYIHSGKIEEGEVKNYSCTDYKKLSPEERVNVDNIALEIYKNGLNRGDLLLNWSNYVYAVTKSYRYDRDGEEVMFSSYFGEIIPTYDRIILLQGKPTFDCGFKKLIRLDSGIWNEAARAYLAKTPLTYLE